MVGWLVLIGWLVGVDRLVGWVLVVNLMGLEMCQGLNSHYFHIIGDGHQPNSRCLYTVIRIPIKGGRSPIPKKTRHLTMAQMGERHQKNTISIKKN